MPYQIKPNRTVVTSFTGKNSSFPSIDYDDGLYVLHTSCDSAAKSHPSSSLSCALSDGSLQMYNAEQLRCIYNVPHAHAKENPMITDLYQIDANQMMSSGMDGTVKLYDVRTKNNNSSPVMTMILANKEQALSVSLGFGNTLAAVGSHKSNIHFYDMRQSNTLVGSYVDAHTEEVTKVRFHETNHNILVSGSEDGLVCLFDTQQPSEEAALVSVCNAQSSIRQVGYFAQDGLYVLTGSESMSLWHGPTAQRLVDFSSSPSNTNLRTELSKQASMDIHYFIDAHHDPDKGLLQLVAGNDDGNIAMFVVSPTNIIHTHTLLSGHKGVVRSISWPSPHTCITAGEDARLVEWNLHPTTATATDPKATTTPSSRSAPTGGGPARRHHHHKSSTKSSRKKNSHNPY